ncbi:helix-turn-helix transcriptional regulator [candidate division WOR-3 bacterium]|nr:helix-turn-helix transcriptional regulator [candidate division WOR-3 bacterium]
MKKLLINNNVRKLRFLNDEMTQKDLSLKVGVSRQTIVAIEKGQYSPSLDLCFKLALAFDKSVDEIFFIDSSKK